MDYDKNYRSYVKQDGLRLSAAGYNVTIDGSGYDDTLKFSQCFNVEVSGYTVIGGNEDSLDCVRGTSYYLHNLRLQPRGRNGITIKGGVKGARLENITFESHGKDCDIELGQWSDYDVIKRPRTRSIEIINCNASDGKPLIVKYWHADKPRIVNSNVKLIWYCPRVAPVYFWLRRKGWAGQLKPVTAADLVLDPREI